MTRRRFNASALGVTVALAAGLATCGPADRQPAEEPVLDARRQGSSAPPVISVEATDYDFTGPATFPSGWVTLQFKNAGEQSHFLLLWRLPEGKTFNEWITGVSDPFNALYADYQAGTLQKAEFMEKLGAALPEWFMTTQRLGGPGFTAAGRTSQTTVHLEPGDYVMECYVRAADQPDKFHGALGMLRPLTVTTEASGGSPPEADIEIALSNYQIAVEGDLSPGDRTVRVRVQENPEGLILHNVHLVRLGDDTAAADAAEWLDWVDAMLPPAPAVFLGGTGQLPAGGESYFIAELEPGRYAWVSETWGIQGMVHEFTVE